MGRYTNFFIMHGVYGNPTENWFPWLKENLEKDGYDVFSPTFPTPEGHNLDNWLKTFSSYLDKVNEESIFIGHSMACAFILSLLENLDKPIKASFLVAGWTGALDDELDELNKTFIDRDFNWEKIKQNCRKFICFGSDNDPWVSTDLEKRLAKDVDGEFILVKGAGHFNEKAGYLTFDLLLSKIKELL